MLFRNLGWSRSWSRSWFTIVCHGLSWWFIMVYQLSQICNDIPWFIMAMWPFWAAQWSNPMEGSTLTPWPLNITILGWFIWLPMFFVSDVCHQTANRTNNLHMKPDPSFDTRSITIHSNISYIFVWYGHISINSPPEKWVNSWESQPMNCRW